MLCQYAALIMYVKTIQEDYILAVGSVTCQRLNICIRYRLFYKREFCSSLYYTLNKTIL